MERENIKIELDVHIHSKVWAIIENRPVCLNVERVNIEISEERTTCDYYCNYAGHLYQLKRNDFCLTKEYFRDRLISDIEKQQK